MGDVKAIHGGCGNVVIAGENIYAGIDEDEVNKIPLSFVVEFKDKDEMRKAMRTGYATFTIFER